MTGHLSHEQFSEWLLGSRDPLAEQHLRACDACRREMETVQGALGSFRDAVRDNGFRTSAIVQSKVRARGLWLKVAAPIGAMALLLVLFWPHKTANQMAPGVAQAATAPDVDSLLSQIEKQTTQAVPASLDPLTKLPTGDNHP